MRPLLAILFCLLIPVGASSDTVYLAVNKSSDVQSLSNHQIKELFTLKRQRWVNNKAVRLLLYDNNELNRTYVENALGIKLYQLKRNINMKVYIGRGLAPIYTAGPTEMITHLETTEGSIGFVGQDLLDKIDLNKVTIISLEQGGVQ